MLGLTISHSLLGRTDEVEVVWGSRISVLGGTAEPRVRQFIRQIKSYLAPGRVGGNGTTYNAGALSEARKRRRFSVERAAICGM
jgi:hypothetical protein